MEDNDEDKTFKALCKPDLQQMIRLWEEFIMDISMVDMMGHTWSARREMFFEKSGWSWNEFFKKRKEYLLRN